MPLFVGHFQAISSKVVTRDFPTFIRITNFVLLQMGAYLDAPIEDKNPEPGENPRFSWGACAMQGWRCGMEDAHIYTELDMPDGSKGMLFCCFDGKYEEGNADRSYTNAGASFNLLMGQASLPSCGD